MTMQYSDSRKNNANDAKSNNFLINNIRCFQKNLVEISFSTEVNRVENYTNTLNSLHKAQQMLIGNTELSNGY